MAVPGATVLSQKSLHAGLVRLRTFLSEQEGPLRGGPHLSPQDAQQNRALCPLQPAAAAPAAAGGAQRALP